MAEKSICELCQEPTCKDDGKPCPEVEELLPKMTQGEFYYKFDLNKAPKAGDKITESSDADLGGVESPEAYLKGIAPNVDPAAESSDVPGEVGSSEANPTMKSSEHDAASNCSGDLEGMPSNADSGTILDKAVREVYNQEVQRGPARQPQEVQTSTLTYHELDEIFQNYIHIFGSKKNKEMFLTYLATDYTIKQVVDIQGYKQCSENLRKNFAIWTKTLVPVVMSNLRRKKGSRALVKELEGKEILTPKQLKSILQLTKE
jgi:hypothetical protein